MARGSRLGFGAGRIGSLEIPERDIERLLHGVLDLGIRVIDTARSYGASEERIGRVLERRRDEFVLATKGGYGIDRVPDWTGEAVTRGIEEARQRLRTDVLDVFFLHSCPLDTLERGEVIDALAAAVERGHVRRAGYSGENEELAWAAENSTFGALECSINVADQRSLGTSVPRAAARGAWVFGKRSLANVAWRHAERPRGDYGEVYWERLRAMALRTIDVERALRFAAFQPGIDTVLVGSNDLEHLRACQEAVLRGPLAEDEVGEIRSAFRTHGDSWRGQV